MAIRIAKGTYMARASGAPRLTNHGEKQTPAVSATMLITEETSPEKGTYLPWNGWLTTDNAKKRTAEALYAMGWDGDPSSFDSAQTKSVYIVVDDEEYNGETKSVIKFINDPDRPRSSAQTMDAGQQQAAMSELRGLVLSMREERAKRGGPTSPAPSKGDSFDFGANAPPAAGGSKSPNAKAGF